MQLAALRTLHILAVDAAARPSDPFAEPHDAIAARRSARAAARAATLISGAGQRISEVLELSLPGADPNRRPTVAHLQHVQSLYRDASDLIREGVNHLRNQAGLLGATPRAAVKPRAVAAPVAPRRRAAGLRSLFAPLTRASRARPDAAPGTPAAPPRGSARR
ncbi:hypothetical protein ACFVH7_12370 [Kitasatospora indigofera]|uniref:hypothetical protein n=1 Tax=Kitasatospora indigofera TaxID=67307 RepID=UPI003640CAB0